ncbi:hypothetical protein QBC35DRAFT_391007 [Podospora australis]|uniref:Uncharacterized protein n=1 Tax=Podospora australis TaxID=1536484 RepID=A0AAN6WNA5_9PEZI|nr:hypothetical protein QBC35DRAFT_391007 [Podospora australis]
MIAEWGRAVDYMSPAITPNRLELVLVCDTDENNSEAARLAIAPLLSLPRLANCHVRLSRKPNPQLQGIAEDAVHQARGINHLPTTTSKVKSASTTPSLTSRFLDLPRELRQHILEYTDLVTPWTEGTWSRHDRKAKKFSVCHIGCADDFPPRDPCPPRIHNGCQFFKCWTSPGGARTGCFCPQR